MNGDGTCLRFVLVTTNILLLSINNHHVVEFKLGVLLCLFTLGKLYVP